jgi:hypothetical protein
LTVDFSLVLVEAQRARRSNLHAVIIEQDVLNRVADGGPARHHLPFERSFEVVQYADRG